MADDDQKLDTNLQEVATEEVATLDEVQPGEVETPAEEQTVDVAEASPEDQELETKEAQELEDAADTTPEETSDDLANEEEAAEKEAEAEKEMLENKEQTTDEELQTSEDGEETPAANDNPDAKWYVVHTFSGHENRVATTLRQRIESEHLENRIYDILVPTQDKIEIRGGKKETVKEKIFPGYILVKMVLDDQAWLAVRTTQGVTAFVGMNNKPTPIPDREVQSIVKFMTQGAPATFKDVFMVNDPIEIIDGPFTGFTAKIESVDKEKGRMRVLVSIFGRETPVELDFLQARKL